jgi:hypothetical protein
MGYPNLDYKLVLHAKSGGPTPTKLPSKVPTVDSDQLNQANMAMLSNTTGSPVDIVKSWHSGSTCREQLMNSIWNFYSKFKQFSPFANEMIFSPEATFTLMIGTNSSASHLPGKEVVKNLLSFCQVGTYNGAGYINKVEVTESYGSLTLVFDTTAFYSLSMVSLSILVLLISRWGDRPFNNIKEYYDGAFQRMSEESFSSMLDNMVANHGALHPREEGTHSLMYTINEAFMIDMVGRRNYIMSSQNRREIFYVNGASRAVIQELSFGKQEMVGRYFEFLKLHPRIGDMVISSLMPYTVYLFEGSGYQNNVSFNRLLKSRLIQTNKEQFAPNNKYIKAVLEYGGS